MNRSTRLPSLSDFDFEREVGINEKEVKINESFKEASAKAYKQFKYDSNHKTGVSKKTDSPMISFKMLEIAPKGFFDNLKEMARVATAEIINSISASETAALIPKHRKNPNDLDLKEELIYVVVSEFNKVDKKYPDIKLLQTIDKDLLLAMVINEVIGLGPLEPLWQEKTVTEIMCNGPKDIQVEINGLVRKVPSVEFRDSDHLADLINKLYISINKQISPTNPYERGRLHDKSRMFAMHKTVAPDGPNFNIRKHAEDYWTPLDIVDKGTASPELMADLGNLIHAGASFLVVGGTGTGKTTLMSALSGFIPSNARVVTIEENLELKLHPKKLIAAPMECIPAKAGSGKEYTVSMRDLVRSLLQMRPDVALVGEVSDGSAYDLCQVLNTGHKGGSTVHANDSYDAINRMRSLVSQEEFVRGPAVLDLIGSAFDIMIVISRLDDGSRKITEVVELGRVPIKAPNGELTLEILPLWNIELDETIVDGKPKINSRWNKVGELSEYRKKKIRLALAKKMSWEELLEISTYNVPGKTKEESE